MGDKPMKVVIVAPHASAKFGGESILPLHYFTRLPEHGVETYMVIHERTRPELELVLGDRIKNVFFIEDTSVHRALYQCSKVLPQRIGAFTFGLMLDLLTQWQQKKLAKSLIKNESIDIVHEPIRVSPKMPSIMYNMGVPVVIGPMNGGMVFPKPFKYLESRSEKYFTLFGRLASGLIHRLLPGKRRAEVLISANDRTTNALPSSNAKIELLVENGVDLNLFSSSKAANESNTNKPFNFVYLGRLVDWKCIDSLLLAANRLNDSSVDFVIEIVGTGEETSALQSLCSDLGLQDKINFHGFVPQEKCVSILQACNCLVLPSVYECGGAVVLEAMAMSKPVIATDWGGPADYLDESCGVLVSPLESRTAFIEQFAEAMKTLMADRARCVKMGEQGRKKVEDNYCWSKKAAAMKLIYQGAIDSYAGRQKEP